MLVPFILAGTAFFIERVSCEMSVTAFWRQPEHVHSLGDSTALVTPVPISNTAVKQCKADDTWGQPVPGKVGRRQDHGSCSLTVSPSVRCTAQQKTHP